MPITSGELQQVMSSKQAAPYEPVLTISDERGNSLALERAAGGHGVLLDIAAPGDSGAPTLFWLKSDRIRLLIDVLKKFQ